MQYRAIVLKATTRQAPDPGLNGLDAIKDPLARLIAAGALLQNSRLSATDIATATDTASSQGWRRPLLAWLGVQLKRSRDSDDRQSATRIQRRIDLVLQGAPKNP